MTGSFFFLSLTPSQPLPQTRQVSLNGVAFPHLSWVDTASRPQGLSVGPHPIPHPDSAAASVWFILDSSASHDGSLAVYAKLSARAQRRSGRWGLAGGDRELQGRGRRPGWRAQRKGTCGWALPPLLPEASCSALGSQGTARFGQIRALAYSRLWAQWLATGGAEKFPGRRKRLWGWRPAKERGRPGTLPGRACRGATGLTTRIGGEGPKLEE
jgi:hypothetical protein